VSGAGPKPRPTRARARAFTRPVSSATVGARSLAIQRARGHVRHLYSLRHRHRGHVNRDSVACGAYALDLGALQAGDVDAAAGCRPSRLAQLGRSRAEACDALHLSVARWAEVDHGSTRREPAGSLEMPRPSAIM
jgi:hypothetical protein